MDFRYAIFIIFIILILTLVYTNASPTPTNMDTPKKLERRPVQDQRHFDGDYRLIIDRYQHEKFVDLLLKYIYKAGDDDKKRTLYAYMASFQIFNLNFHHKRLEKLDEKLKGVYLTKKDIQYPTWSKYPNLQIAIANISGRDLTDTEYRFTGDAKSDRKMVNIYLLTLYDILGVVMV